MRILKIYFVSQAEFTPEQRLRHSMVAFAALFTGFGLSIFLSLTHAWPLSFLPTSLTLFFSACGLFLLSRIGWRGILSSLESTDFNPLKSWAFGLAWVIALCVYLQSSFLGRVFEQVPKLRAYYADPACSSKAMYKLARTTPLVTPREVLYPVPSAAAVCTVGWVQADRNGPIAAHPYARYFTRDAARGVHKGDMLVVQTAFGHVSAVLYPGRDFIDLLFFPRGTIIHTGYQPERMFEELFMENFWFLFFFLFFGSAALLRLLASLKVAIPSLYKSGSNGPF